MWRSIPDFHLIIVIHSTLENGLEVAKLMREDDADGGGIR